MVKIDKDLKKALGLVVFFATIGYVNSGLNGLLKGTGWSPSELTAVSPIAAFAFGVLAMFLIFEWGIRK